MAGSSGNTWIWLLAIGGGAYYFRDQIAGLLTPAAAVAPLSDPAAPVSATAAPQDSSAQQIAALIQAQQQGLQQISQQNSQTAAEQLAAFQAAITAALKTNSTTPPATPPKTPPPAAPPEPDYIVTGFNPTPAGVNPVLQTPTGTVPVSQLTLTKSGQFAVLPTAGPGQAQLASNLYSLGVADNNPLYNQPTAVFATKTGLSGLRSRRKSCGCGGHR